MSNEINKDLLNALLHVKEVIDNSDQWWIDSPDKGGFDKELIEKALDKAV